MIKVLIVDDEPGMRVLLRKIINKVDGFEIVDEAESGEKALEIIIDKNIDLVFLDVEMGDLNGVDTAKSLMAIKPNIKVIFATAHGEYMGSAFEVYAYDYLLKPFRVDRVFRTLDKFKKEYDEYFYKKERYSEKIMIKNKESNKIINKKDIVFISRENGETVIYTNDEKHKTSMTLNDLEIKMDHNDFLRVHKSYIVNKNKIREIYPYGRWTYIIKFYNLEEDALMTQSKYEILKEEFKWIQIK